MTDNDIIKAFLPLLKAGLTANGITADVLQSYQPTMQGARTIDSIYFFKIDDARIGSPGHSSAYNGTTELMDETDTQLHEAVFQFSAWVRQTTTSTTTAQDLLTTVALIMQTRPFIEAMKALGIGVLRVTELRNPYFKDDRDQYQTSPSFDVSFSYNRSIAWTDDALASIEFNVSTT